MTHGAIDLGKKMSQVCILKEDGEIIECRLRTDRDRFAAVFVSYPRIRVLIEAGTESEWVARCLEELGHEVIVADPNYAPMYGSRSRKVKTDRRDTAALTDACRMGIYRRAHRVSALRRAERQRLRIRRHLVQVRSGSISLLRALLRQDGYRLARVTAATVTKRLTRLELPASLTEILAPLCAWLDELTTVLADADQDVDARAAEDAVAQRLMTAPGVGPVVALTYQAVLDDPARFGGNAARASAFIGLVPSEDSSAERRHKGHITKAGPGELRALLVQASWAIWRGRSAAGQALRTWAHALADRRGRRIAIVALARRLSRIVFALWRDGSEFSVDHRRSLVTA